ncbi:MAG: tyrosine-type recombinase/integrase [Nitriliruptoraceae bacterium]
MVATFAGTGVRRGELLRLRVGDLDVDAGVITVTDERGREREVPIRPKTVEVLAGYLAQVRPVCPSSPWLFANPRASFESRWHGRLEPFVAGAIVRRAGRVTDVDGPHTCTRWRVTAGVDLLRAGVPVEEVARRLGQRDAAAMGRYRCFVDGGQAG